MSMMTSQDGLWFKVFFFVYPIILLDMSFSFLCLGL
jgi:hypothetical protein